MFCQHVALEHGKTSLSPDLLPLVHTFLASRQYHEALESYKNMAQQMKNLTSFIKSLDSVMNQRLQAYADLRRCVVMRKMTISFY